ncbi:MAG: hypothetical protein JO316_20090 [Abitibacteriaceae bacterium]|nr:hypothetical protein [Abditibacteriaceae bacterium]
MTEIVETTEVHRVTQTDGPASEVKKAPPRASKLPVLFQKTQRLVAELEAKLDATFLSYWTSCNGSVCWSDVVGLHEILQTIGPQQKIVLFLKSDGGSGLAALRIVHLLRHYAPRLIAFVPLDCASAATMIALGANEIHMGPMAYLTAVDTSLTHDLSPVNNFNRAVSVSQDELTRVVDLWRREANEKSPNPYQALYQHVHPLVVGAVDRASSLSIKVCTEILSYHMEDRDEATKISNHLNKDYPSHDYPITLEEAKLIGLKVQPLEADLNFLLLQLNKLYSEMGQKSYTFSDEHHAHDNEILNILEGRNIQVYYQNDTDRHYRKEERRWVRTNDESSWRKIERKGSRTHKSVFHIR